MVALASWALDRVRLQLALWISCARRSRDEPCKHSATTSKRNLAEVLEHFRPSLSNDFAEAINGRIQAAKTNPNGYATDERPLTDCYLIRADIKHLPANPWLRPAQPTIG